MKSPGLWQKCWRIGANVLVMAMAAAATVEGRIADAGGNDMHFDTGGFSPSERQPQSQRLG